MESRGSVPTGGRGGRYPTLPRNQSSDPPGVLGLAIEAGLPKLGIDNGPPPGVAGDVRECSLALSWEAGDPPLSSASPSLPLLEQLCDGKTPAALVSGA